MIEQDTKNQVFYPEYSLPLSKKISHIEFSDKAIVVWYKDDTLNIPFENIKDVSIGYLKGYCCIKYEVGWKTKILTCYYKKSDLKQIKKIFNEKNINVSWLPEMHMDLFRYSDDDKKWQIFSCWAKEWYRYWLRTFIIITLVIWGFFLLIWDPESISVWILISGIFILLILWFLLLIIKERHLWLTVLDDGIIMRMYDFDHDHIERVKVTYNYIENITISQTSKNRYDIKIKTKWNDEFEIRNLKNWKKLQEELKRKWMNKVNFIPKNDEIVRTDPPYI